MAKLRWIPREVAELKKQIATGERVETIAAKLTQILGREITPGAVRDKRHSLGLGPKSRTNFEVDFESTEGLAELEDVEEPFQTPSKGDELITRLVKETRRTRGFVDLCDLLDLSPKRLHNLIEQARRKGLRIDVAGDQVGRPPSASDGEQTVEGVAQSGDWRIIALVGDIHLGNKHHMGPQLHDFCKIAYSRGVRTFCHVGDLLDGVYGHSIWEQTHRGFEEQCSHAVTALPQMPGATWEFIEGNHDETLGEKNGLAVGPAIVAQFNAMGRHDIKYHGSRGAYLRLKAAGDTRGLLLHMWHPRDRGNAYARTYVDQKKIEGYPVGGKPDILARGHHHTQSYITTRGVHAFGCGCWQGSQSSFGKSLRTAPDIGSWIVEYALTDTNTLRSVKAEWVAYYETEEVREVGLG